MEIPEEGLSVHLRGYGWVFVFKFVAKNGRIDYVTTNMENPTREQVKHITDARWSVEVYHREVKQTCEIERCQARTGRAQRNHIFLAIAAWFEQHKRRITQKITLYQQNWDVIKNAIQEQISLEKARERYLTLEEIKELWHFLDSDKNHISVQIKNSLKIILLTGVRSGELRVAKWSEFDFNESLWTVPAVNTKTGIILRVHLTSYMKNLLLELKKNNSSEYVISGLNSLSCLSDKAIPKAVNRIQERLNIPQWTPHDLRRTFATQLGETLNIDPVVIEKCLGHKMPKIMATYNKNEMLPQRKDALEKWADFIKDLVFESDHDINNLSSEQTIPELIRHIEIN